MRSAVLCALALSGCWVSSDQIVKKIRDVDVDTDTVEDLGPIEMTSIEPVYGVNSGGTEVTIVVGPLGEDVEVTFGGSPAVVISHTADQVVVETPAVQLEGPVDVAVRTGRYNDRLSGAFYYWADGAGLTGLIGSVNSYDMDRPYLAESAFERDAALLYIEPMELRYSSLYGAGLDQCARNYTRSGPSWSIMRPGLESISLTDGTERFNAFPDQDGEIYSLPTKDGSFKGGVRLDLEQTSGNAGWPELVIEDLVQMPASGFKVTSPNLDGAIPTVTEGFDLKWSGGTPGDYVIVRIFRYEGDTQVDRVYCLLRDDGQHRIDASLFTGWWWTSEMEFWVGRAHVSEATVPFNGADVEVVGVQWYVGLAWQN